MNYFIEKLLFPIIVGAISTLISVSINLFIKKQENKNNAPLLQSYKLNNIKTKQLYIDEIQKCDYKYILTYTNQQSDNNKEYNNTDNKVIFKLLNNKAYKKVLEKDDMFALCFYNKIENTSLSINSLISSKSEFQLINDETILSALLPNQSVAILCHIYDIPKSFSGSFQGHNITYFKVEYATKQIIPIKSKGKK